MTLLNDLYRTLDHCARAIWPHGTLLFYLALAVLVCRLVRLCREREWIERPEARLALWAGIVLFAMDLARLILEEVRELLVLTKLV